MAPLAATGLGGWSETAVAGALLDRARARLAAAGVDTPALDAELLLAEVLGVSRGALLADGRRRASAAQRERFIAWVDRRLEHEPVAYLLGRKGFRHIELAVDAGVLIPRPETEGLVEAALALPAGARVLDVGTGSGAVALALAHERPDLRVLASDVSPGALSVARANAARLGLDVAFFAGDLLDCVDGPLDAVLSNPPYVADGELLAPDVERHEPALALRGGADGLAVIRRLIAAASPRAPFLALEVGAGQAGAVCALARAAGYGEVSVTRDLASIPRIVTARRC